MSSLDARWWLACYNQALSDASQAVRDGNTEAAADFMAKREQYRVWMYEALATPTEDTSEARPIERPAEDPVEAPGGYNTSGIVPARRGRTRTPPELAKVALELWNANCVSLKGQRGVTRDLRDTLRMLFNTSCEVEAVACIQVQQARGTGYPAERLWYQLMLATPARTTIAELRIFGQHWYRLAFAWSTERDVA